MVILPCGLVDSIEMRGNVGMGIKAVDNIEILDHFRCLLWQVGGASSAENHNINPIFHRGGLFCGVYLCSFR